MKKLFAAILVCAIIMSAAACGSQQEEAAQEITETEVVEIESILDAPEITDPASIKINGIYANSRPSALYDGLGMVSANNSSRLLLDYKSEHPDAYNELLEYMFGESGMGLSLIKIEMGADVDSSSGTEPAVKRTADEPADVTRGAGYQLAADALAINPDIKIDLLYWGIPSWVASAEDQYAAMYQWYKETIDAMYDTYGIKVTHVTATRNEKAIDADWIIYLSNALKNEPDGRYDYGTIKIVAGEAVSSWGICKKLLENEELLNAVDVVSAHYTSWTNENALTLQRDYGKELWFSEGSSPMAYSAATRYYDSTRTGLGGLNGMLDIATRITQAMTEGMTMYEFQPAVSAYYSGATYFPKQLITANQPWSGAYSFDTGFYMCQHFSRFIKSGWEFIDGACYGDGKAGGDGHAIVDSTYNYITCADPQTGDYSTVIVNNSSRVLNYTVTVSNLAKASNVVSVWETSDNVSSEEYYSTFFRRTGNLTPDDNGDGSYSYRFVVKPFSLVTVSTLDVSEFTGADRSGDCGIILAPDYTDDFEYADYPADYLSSRGRSPRYTTDQGGAFEVKNTPDGNILVQQITQSNKPTDWGMTSDPVTCLGDDRWHNYTVSIDALFDDSADGAKLSNYVGIGARYILADSNQSGYWLKLYTDGSCELLKNSTILASGKVPGFDPAAWNRMSITVCGSSICCSVNEAEVIKHTDTGCIFNSGRAAIYSSYQRSCFDNLTVSPADEQTVITRADNFDGCFEYSGGSSTDTGKGWLFNTMCSYKYFNRTVSTGYAGAEVTLTFSSTGFALIGTSDGAEITVNTDGTTSKYVCPSAESRQTLYCCDTLSPGEHTVTIKINNGSLSIDAAEFAA